MKITNSKAVWLTVLQRIEKQTGIIVLYARRKRKKANVASPKKVFRRCRKCYRNLLILEGSMLDWQSYAKKKIQKKQSTIQHPSRYDNTHFERELQKQKKQEDEGETPIKRRRSSFASDNFKLGSLICCFCNGNDVQQNLCAAGAYHSSQRKNDTNHANYLTNEWKDMTSVIGDDDILVRLSSDDAHWGASPRSWCYIQWNLLP